MIELTDHGGIVELHMDRPPANAMTTEFIEALAGAHRRACEEGARVCVISGRDGMFSAGLDVPVLLPLDRDAIASFWQAFLGLLKQLVTSPVPVVAAITGHSPAGGAVLAIHCDYRIAADGSFRIGLNEVQVGLPVPRTVFLALQGLVGSRVAQRLAMRGELLTPGDALSLGLVDELWPAAEVIPRSVEWARELTALPPIAMNATRRLARSALAATFDTDDDVRVVTDYWFSDETQAAMRRLVERLNKPKA